MDLNNKNIKLLSYETIAIYCCGVDGFCRVRYR